MRETDVRVEAVEVAFRAVRLSQPLSISGRLIDWFTIAEVDVAVRSRAGQRACGRGATVLSVPWAWPHSHTDVSQRDTVLRQLTEQVASGAVGAGPADPLELWREQHEELANHLSRLSPQGGAIPELAGLLALGALDNAIHDAWAWAAARPAWSMYDEQFLSSDLGWLDSRLRGTYPGSFAFQHRYRLPVQHVVGVNDALGPDGLRGWLEREHVHHLKLKVAGEDPTEDARRIAQIFEVASRHVSQAHLAIDPNEGYAGGDAALAMLTELAGICPKARQAVVYLEQPVPRRSAGGEVQMRALTQEVPTLLDEGFTDLSLLPELGQRGWSGVVLKASKGQSPALLASTWARATGAFATVQDLTTVGLAYAHSARLVSALPLSSVHLEYNSRQYAPGGQGELAQLYPELTMVAGGEVRIPGIQTAGLYGLETRASDDGRAS